MGIRKLVRSRYPDIKRENTRSDAMAGLVLGVESVPDGLANGLLAGVNPIAGLYGYLYGMVGAAFFTSASFMAVQATGAMAIIVADVDLAGRDDPAQSLFTLTVVTGIVMIVAGVLKLGTVLRFVSKAVITGFITAVGPNIILGQLDNFTGYDASGGNRVLRALDLVTHAWKFELATTAVGVTTIVLIVVLQRTALGSLGLVVAVAVGSAIAAQRRVPRRAIHEVELQSSFDPLAPGLPQHGVAVRSKQVGQRAADVAAHTGDEYPLGGRRVVHRHLSWRDRRRQLRRSRRKQGLCRPTGA